VKLPALESVDMARSVGFDLAVIDGEHSQLDEGAILALVRHAAAVGLATGEELSGGVSDGCWTSAEGIPSLDGLGPVGALDHTVEEWIDLETMEQRLELAVRLIASADGATRP